MWDNTEHPEQHDEHGGYSSWLADLAFFAAIGLSCCTLGLIIWAVVS